MTGLQIVALMLDIKLRLVTFNPGTSQFEVQNESDTTFWPQDNRPVVYIFHNVNFTNHNQSRVYHLKGWRALTVKTVEESKKLYFKTVEESEKSPQTKTLNRMTIRRTLNNLQERRMHRMRAVMSSIEKITPVKQLRLPQESQKNTLERRRWRYLGQNLASHMI